MKIHVKDLRTVTQRAFDTVEERYGGVIELNEDLYWSIPRDARYNVDIQPGKLDIGSLAEDYDEIRKVLTGEHDVIRYDLAYLGSTLVALGEAIDIQSNRQNN